MTQIFFVSPEGYMPVRSALSGIPGQRTHGWMDTDASPSIKSVIGVAEVTSGDTEEVATRLEAQGVLLLPDHRLRETLPKNIADALVSYGVTSTDTTASAMTKIYAKSGFSPHKVKRYV